MSSYTHLTLSERKNLQKLLSEGKSMRKIADILGRSPSTISREIKRNHTKYKPKKKSNNRYWYNYWRAQNLYIRRRRANKIYAIKENTLEWDFVISGLKKYWSPESICGRWHAEYPNKKALCFSTIYRSIKNKRLPQITSKTHLRRHGRRKHYKDSNYNTIHPDRIIPEWTEEIRTRSRIGDWEGDTVYGGVGKGLLVTMVDRKSRYLRIGLLKNRNATETRITIEQLMKGLPVTSISLDNGSEFSEFRELERSLNTEIYFAEPHKPWQRGTNENTNDIVRFFFPKGFDFRAVSYDDILMVEDIINNRPRKCLNWKSPKEVFFNNCVALD